MWTQVVSPETLNLDRLEESQDTALIIIQLYLILLKSYLIIKQCISTRLIITNVKYYQESYTPIEQFRSLEEVLYLFFFFYVEIITWGLIMNTAFNFQFLGRDSTYKP